MASARADLGLESPVSIPPAAHARRRALGDSKRLARHAAPALLAAAIALVALVWAPPTADLAAADYRAWLFGHEGWAVWDLQWYAGHHMPGYSLLYPPLGWWLGPRLVGALSAVAVAILFERIAREHVGERALVGALWLAAGTGATLLSGRITFGLGLVPALGAVLALQLAAAAPSGTRRRKALAALALLLAVITPIASPVAALFLALGGVAYALAEPLPRAARAWPVTPTPRRFAGLALAGAAFLPVGLLSLAFPEGGREPFVFSAFWPTVAFAAVAFALVPRSERTLRVGVVLYLLGCVAAFVLDTPAGGNVARLGALFGGPLLALVLWRRRTAALALLALPLLFWQWTAAAHDTSATYGTRIADAAYYAPLLRFLDEAERSDPSAVGGRVEIPFTRLHWEARHVAPMHALARGWERQLDLKENGLFYDGTLTAARYRGWLHHMAVRWVALPTTAELDYSAEQEERLIERGLPYLRQVWRTRDWRVFAVRDATPLVSGPARMTRLETDAIALDVSRPSRLLLRAHWTPYWDVTAGDACVAPAGEWTRLDVRSPGPVRLGVRFSLGRVGATSPRCAGG